MNKLEELYTNSKLYKKVYEEALKQLKEEIDIEEIECLTYGDIEDIVEDYYLENY